jgi:hypothetical protein
VGSGREKMQKPKGTWTKVAAMTAIVCVVLGVGYALIRIYQNETGYYLEYTLPNGQKFTVGDFFLKKLN